VQRLPEAHTDMIFAIIGEELGLIGVACVLAAFAALAWAGFSIALAAKDPFGKRIAAGVTALIVGQAAINFGGVLSIVPLTGVPLPLISYGGSSLITTLAGIGVVLAVAAREREPQTARRPQAVEAVTPPPANVRRLERPAGRPQRRTRRTAAQR
jgi:cell division protein FtsW